MAAKGDVELIIRAKNEATKNLDSINKSLKDLADQQILVGDSASTADDKLGRLGLELQKLQTNANNLKALSTVGDVLDKAGAAMERQRTASAEAGAEFARVAQRQKEVAAESDRLAASLKEATTEVTKQQAALDRTKNSYGAASKEATALANSEASLVKQLATAETTLGKRQAALDAAAKKQADLSAAIAGSEKVTKAQQNSFDAANRALERRRAAVDEVVAKETALRNALAGVRQSMGDNTAAILNANKALTDQSVRTDEAKTRAAGLKTEYTGMAQAQREIVKDVTAATTAVEQQATALQTAESEYSQIAAVAAAARSAIAGSAVSTKDAGDQASRAALQVGVFAAKLAALSGAGGKTANPLSIDPAAINAAEKSIEELSKTIDLAGDEATAASVSAKEMAAAMKGVGAAQSSLQGISTAISAQEAAVNGANMAWKTAEAEVRRLAIAIKAADQPSAALAAAFGKAQAAARLAKDEFLRQTDAATKIGTAFQNAGMGVGTLESAQASLAPKIQRANDLMNQAGAAASKLSQANQQAGSSAGSAEPKVNRLANALGAMLAAANRVGSATNPLRMFKNELVSMAATVGGLYAIKEQLTSIWDAGSNLAANTSKFTTAFGSMAEGNKELAYAREVATNLKLPIDALTKSYADLALSAKGTSMEGEGARKVFVAFAQVARVNQMSTDSLQGTYTALTQIMSKGKVQAEELRGQLGDRLPGALQLMATGLGVTTEKLDSMMEKGELTRETLLNMAAAASSQVGPALVAALDSPAAKLQDFQNRMLVFKETVAGSGFLDAIADAFDRMAKALSTPEAIQAAKDLGVALADIVKWATELVSSGNLDAIGNSIAALGIAWVGVQITTLISGLYGFTAAIGATAIAVFGLDVALAPVVAGLGVLAGVVATVVGAFGLWKLAEWVYNNVPAFAEGMLTIKNAALSSWDAIGQMWELTSANLVASFTGVTSKIRQMWYGLINDIMSVAPEITAKLGLGDYAKDITARFAEANQDVLQGQQNLQEKIYEINNRYAAKEAERNKQLQDDIAGYHSARINAELTEEERAAAKRQAAALTAVPTQAGVSFPGAAPATGNGAGTQRITASPYVPDDTKAREAAAKKAAAARLALENQVANQMFTIRAQLEKKSADTLDEQLAAVPAKYAKLYGQLTALGKDRNSEEWKTVDALVAQEQQNLKAAAAKKAEVAAAKESRAATKAENESRKAAMEQVNTLLTTRKNIQEQIKQAEASGDVVAVEALKANLVTVTAQANDAINGMLTFWRAVGGQEADAAIAKLETMKLQLTRVKDEGILTGQNIGKALGSNLKTGFDSFIDKIAETGDVIGSLKDAFLEFARSFLIEIAKMIMQQILFNAVKAGLSAIGGGGAIGAGLGAAVSAGVNHSGGRIGGTQNRTRNVSASVFANAVKYHGGGVAGLKSNEVPTILEAGETVRTEQQEKALAEKQAAASSGGSASPVSLKIVNQIDSGEMVSAGLGSASGEKAFINAISTNRDTIKRIIG
ncbi:tape measure protein [Sinorhizobium medicae]|nr:tape measure protein [Sinorhizobium medicae]